MKLDEVYLPPAIEYELTKYAFVYSEPLDVGFALYPPSYPIYLLKRRRRAETEFLASKQKENKP